jgi:formate hydrogenlyase subunit 3/multisubunit Na+/H+ antiporter MnhD subunit
VFIIRIYKFFNGKNAEWNEEDYHYSTSLALSAWEFMLVFCISMTLRVLLPLEAHFQSVLFVLLFLGAAVASLIYNRRHFKDKIQELNKKYKNSQKDKWLKNWVFMVFYFLSIIFFVFFPFIFSNLLRWILGG